VFNVCLKCIIQSLRVWTQTRIDGRGKWDPWREEADDLTKAWGWWRYARTLLGRVSCEGECDVTISTCALFTDAVKLTRIMTTKNYETNDNINKHKISPQIRHALMGFRRRSGLTEGTQSNYIQHHQHSSYKCRMKNTRAWVSGGNKKVATCSKKVSDQESCLKGAKRLTYSGCSEFIYRPTYYLDRDGAVCWGTATRRKVADSSPHDVNGIFHWHNPSGRTMALETIQPPAEMSTRNITWGVKAVGALGWQSYHFPVPIVKKSEGFNLPQPYWSVLGLHRNCFTLLSTIKAAGAWRWLLTPF
jgi:hypothetical protein